MRAVCGWSLAFATISLLVPLDSSAKVLRRTCRDGVLVERALGASGMVGCDVDGRCDGECTFGLPACEGTSCQTEDVTIRTGASRRMRVALEPGADASKVVLRCRAHPRDVPCDTFTTTTSGPTTTGPTTNRPGRIRPPSTVTSTTTPEGAPSPTTSTGQTTTTFVFATSTTSLPPAQCVDSNQCLDVANPCFASFCQFDNTCSLPQCICLTPDRTRFTCDRNEAACGIL